MFIRNALIKTLSVVVALLSLSATAADYTFDKGHTEIMFNYSHVGNSTSYVSFNDYDGTFELDVKKPENSAIDVTIQVASIDSGLAEFDEHLRGKDFFQADKYPTGAFCQYRDQSDQQIGMASNRRSDHQGCHSASSTGGAGQLCRAAPTG